jgi:hypothetical protein
MNCLQNYIGVRDCGLEEPPSGLYINNLAGITTEMLSFIAEKENGSYRGAWTDIQTVAAQRFYVDIMSKLSSIYKLNKTREAFNFAPVIGISEPAGPEYRGIVMDYNMPEQSFQTFTINTITLQSASAGKTTLAIFAQDGRVLYSKIVDVVIGKNTYYVDKRFACEKLFAAFDFTAIDGYEGDISLIDTSCFCSVVRNWCATCEPAFYGATMAAGVMSETSYNAHGVGITGTAGCSLDSVVCNNKDLFTSAWLFLLGNQTLLHAMNSTRVNKFTIADVNALKDFYQVEYEKALSESIKGLNIDITSNCCITCNDSEVKPVQWLP